MAEIKHENDILVATLNSPKAEVTDFLKSGLTSENTGLLSADEYKNSDYIKKQFSDDNGNFNEFAFDQYYKKASDNYESLSNKESYDEFEKQLEYSPTSMSSPLGAKKKNMSTEYSKIFNPEQRARSISGINVLDEPTKTKEEIAQGNKYLNTTTGEWSEKSLDDQNFFKKMFGQSYAYATYDENTIDEEGIKHYAGEWKLDETGNYYTETIGNQQLKNKQIVKVADILTDEDGFMNKIDFFDSDGYTKSITGTAVKTMVQIAPYLIPGVNTYYAALTTGIGLAETLPILYNSIESILTGKNESTLSKAANSMSNYMGKYSSSMSYEGREKMFGVEGLGNLISSTFSQLHQQRTAASLSKYIIPESLTDLASAKKRNKLSKGLSLGYMALVSSSDVYKEALNSGYNERTAGFASLMSAGALYSVMNFNSGTNGFGTWFLDKTTGYNRDIERSTMKKAIKPFLGDFEKGLNQLTKEQDPNKLVTAIKKFKRTVSKGTDFMIGRSESLWKNAITEGAEEVSEEVIQDTVKGMFDSLGSIGINVGENASFKTLENTFSKKGLERYVSTFLGGALGGALFEVNSKYIEPMYNPALKRADKQIQDIIIEGNTDLLISEVNRFRKSFNDKLSPIKIKQGDQEVNVLANEGKSQADLIADATINHIKFLDQQLKPEKEIYAQFGGLFNFEQFNKNYDKEKINEYIKQDFSSIVSGVKQQQDLVNDLKSKENIDNDLLKVEEAKLKNKTNELNNFFNGKNYFNYNFQLQLFRNKSISSLLASFDKNSYTYHKYHKIYDELPEESEVPGILTKKEIDLDYDDYKKELPNDVFSTSMKQLQDLYIKLQKDISSDMFDYEQTKDSQQYIDYIKEYQDSITQILSNGQEINTEKLDDNFKEFIQGKNQFNTSLYNYNIGTISNKNNFLKFNDNLNEEQKNIIVKMVDNYINNLGIKDFSKSKIELAITNVNKLLRAEEITSPYVAKLRETFNDKVDFNLINEYVSLDKSFDINDVLSDNQFDEWSINSKDQIKELLPIYKYLSELEINSEQVKENLKNSKDYFIDMSQEENDVHDEYYYYYLQNGNFDSIFNDNKLEEDVKEKHKKEIKNDIDNGFNKDSFKFTEKYNKLLQRKNVLKENPIKTALKKMFISKSDSIYFNDLFEKLIDLDEEINNFDDISDFLKSNAEILEFIESGRSVLDVFTASLQGMVRSEGRSSLNDQIADIVDLYEDNNYKSEDFKSIIQESANDAMIYVQHLMSKFNRIQELSSINQNSKMKEDYVVRANMNFALLGKYKEGIKIGERHLFSLDDEDDESDIKKGFDNINNLSLYDLESLIIKIESKIYEKLSELNDEEKKQFIEDLIQTYKTGYDNEFSINDFIENENKENKIAPFLSNKLIELLIIHPTEFNQMFLDVLSDEDIVPKIDQEIALKQLYAKHKNPELYKFYLQKQYEKFNKASQNPSNNLKTLQNGININEVSGLAGSGKTSVVGRLYAKMIHKENNDKKIYVTSITEQKVNDLKNAITVAKEENVMMLYADGNKNGIFDQLFDIKDLKSKRDSFINDLKTKLNEKIDEQKNNKDNKSNNTYEQEEFNVSEIGTFVVTYLANGNDFDLKSIEFKPDENLKVSDEDIELFLVADEVTLFDPFTMAMLNFYAENTNSNITVFGDKDQKAYNINLSGTKFNVGINNYYTNKTPKLRGMFRAENRSQLDNSLILHNIASKYNKVNTNVNFTKTSQENISDYYLENSLKYNSSTEVNENGVYDLNGLYIVKDQDVYKKELDKIIKNLQKNTNETLSILVPNGKKDIMIDEILGSSLTDLGLQGRVFKYVEDSLESGIQGSEATYTLLYELEAASKNNDDGTFSMNGDIDTQSIYTYATRAKQFTLVKEVDIQQKGLFSHYQIECDFNNEKNPYTLSKDQINSIKQNYIEMHKELNSQNPIPQKKVVNKTNPDDTSATTSNDNKTNSNDTSTTSNSDDNSTITTTNNDDNNEDSKKTNKSENNTSYVKKGVENSTQNNEDIENSPVEKSSVDLKNYFKNYDDGLDNNNLFILDSYYTRVGIDKNKFNDTIQCGIFFENNKDSYESDMYGAKAYYDFLKNKNNKIEFMSLKEFLDDYEKVRFYFLTRNISKINEIFNLNNDKDFNNLELYVYKFGSDKFNQPYNKPADDPSYVTESPVCLMVKISDNLHIPIAQLRQYNSEDSFKNIKENTLYYKGTIGDLDKSNTDTIITRVAKTHNEKIDVDVIKSKIESLMNDSLLKGLVPITQTRHYKIKKNNFFNNQKNEEDYLNIRQLESYYEIEQFNDAEITEDNVNGFYWDKYSPYIFTVLNSQTNLQRIFKGKRFFKLKPKNIVSDSPLWNSVTFPFFKGSTPTYFNDLLSVLYKLNNSEGSYEAKKFDNKDDLNKQFHDQIESILNTLDELKNKVEGNQKNFITELYESIKNQTEKDGEKFNLQLDKNQKWRVGDIYINNSGYLSINNNWMDEIRNKIYDGTDQSLFGDVFQRTPYNDSQININDAQFLYVYEPPRFLVYLESKELKNDDSEVIVVESEQNNIVNNSADNIVDNTGGIFSKGVVKGVIQTNKSEIEKNEEENIQYENKILIQIEETDTLQNIIDKINAKHAGLIDSTNQIKLNKLNGITNIDQLFDSASIKYMSETYIDDIWDFYDYLSRSIENQKINNNNC